MIFDCPKGKAKRDEDAGEGASNRPNNKKNTHPSSWISDGLMFGVTPSWSSTKS